MAVSLGVVPAHPHHRLVGGVQVAVLPVQGGGVAGGLEEAGVLGVGGQGGGQVKRLQGYPVRRGFVGVAAGFIGGAPHQVAAAGDAAKTEALGLEAVLGPGRLIDGQQQPAQEEEPGFVASAQQLPLPGAGQFFGVFHEGRR